jgi:hypothetical protein
MKKYLLFLFALSSAFVFGQSIQSISPGAGMQGQLLTISITGQSTIFQQGTNVIKLVQNGTGAMISPSSANFISNTKIDATFPISINQTTGIYDLVIEKHLMTSTLTLANSFTLTSSPNPPVLSSISPASCKQGDTIAMTINGVNTNFNAGSNTVSLNNGAYVVNTTTVVVINNTTMQAKFIFNNSSSVGDYNLNVYNAIDGSILLSNAFHLNIGLKPARIKKVNPNSGMQFQTLTVSITGQNTAFQQGSNSININAIKLNQGGSNIFPVTQNFVNDTLANATFSFNANDQAGVYDVVVYNYLNTSLILANSFTLNTNPNPPSLSSISPISGSQGDVITLTINGLNTNFNSSNNTIWINNGSYVVNASSVTVINNTTLQAKLYLDTSPVGYYTVNISNSLDGTLSLASAFNLLAGTNPPKLVSVSPNSAAQGETLTVSITGQRTHFQQASNVIKLVQGATSITPISSTFINDTLITADFTFSNSHPIGLYAINVNNYSLPSAFTLNSKLVSISPTSAVQGDTVMITITGANTNFTTAADSVWLKNIYGGKFCPTSITVVNNTILKAKFIFKNFPLIGLYSVFIKNNIDGSNEIKNAFTLNSGANSPTITKVTPNTGWLGQSVTINIYGKHTHFQQGLDNTRLANETMSSYPTSMTVVNDTLITANFTFSNPTYQPMFDVLVEGHENAVFKNGFQISIPIEVPELPTEESITIFPNPTSGLLNLVLNKNIEDVRLTITDIQGKVIYNQNNIVSESIQVDLTGYENGVYILHFGNIKYHTVKKITLIGSKE